MQNLLFLCCLALSLAGHAALGRMRWEQPSRPVLKLDPLKSGDTTIRVEVVPATVTPQEVAPPVDLPPPVTRIPEPVLRPVVRSREVPDDLTVPKRSAPSERVRMPRRALARTEIDSQSRPEIDPMTARKLRKQRSLQPLTENVAIPVPRPAAQATEIGARVSAKLKTRVPVLYPQELQREGVEGRVVLIGQVEPSGRLVAVSVKTSSGHESLDQAALAAVRQWVFRPALRGGKATRQQVLIPVEFRVRDADPEQAAP